MAIKENDMLPISPDELWMAALEDFTYEAINYFLGQWALDHLDFSRQPEFFDKDLRILSPYATKRRRHADKLVKVYLKDGSEQWVLIHIEVQGYKDRHFAERMFTYFIRIRERWYPRQVTCIALYTDGRQGHHPESYRHEFAGTEIVFRFNTLKLWEKTEEALFASDNVFSLLLLAAKKVISKTNHPDKVQLQWKLQLIKTLLGMDVEKEKARKALTFIGHIINFKAPESVKIFEAGKEDILQQKEIAMGLLELIESKTEEMLKKERKEKEKLVRQNEKLLKQREEEQRQKEELLKQREEERRQKEEERRQKEEERRQKEEERRQKEELLKEIEALKRQLGNQ